MTPLRRSALFAIVLGGLLLGVLSACSAGNPNLSKAEDAMQRQNYEQALANIDSALAQDSASVEAYKMRAQILRQMADSTMPPEEYKDLYRRAREAERAAIKFNPGARSEVEGQQTLAYTQQYRKGAKVFRRAQRTADSSDYRQAAAHFGAASATYPDSSDAILNEAYARLNMERMKQSGSMTNAIPILKNYVEKDEQPQKNAYDILSALYLQDGQTEAAIDLLETARKDLSSRPTQFRLTGSRGLKYSGTVEAGGSAREVEGTVPANVTVEGDGMVSGTFQKQQEKGQLRVQLFYKGSSVADTTVQKGAASLSANLSEEAPLAQLEGRLLNAYNRAGQTQKAMAEYREQIEENPNNVTYRYNYGSMLLNADRFDEAIEQLRKAVELEPGNVKAQYNLGAAFTNKGRVVQDSLRSIEDSLSTIRDAALEENRAPTAEEKRIVNELDKESKRLAQKKRNIFEQAIPPLERARQLADSGESLRTDACRALVTAYIQTEQVEQAEEYQQCAGMQIEQGQTQQEQEDGGGS
jgi:tetratricopeptide (TPR) repeat protein